jgi:hypothetical protein
MEIADTARVGFPRQRDLLVSAQQSRKAEDLRMKKKQVMLGIGLTVSLGTGWVLLPGQAPEKESDPVKLTPHMYKVRLENAYVRVLEYHSEPGEKEPMHFHPPGVVYYFSEDKLAARREE